MTLLGQAIDHLGWHLLMKGTMETLGALRELR